METQILTIWTPHQAQKQIQDSKARYKVVVAGRRTGKTYASICILVKKALLNPNSNYFYIAPYYRQAKMIAWKLLNDKAIELPKELIIKRNESELYVSFANGSKISIKGADDPDALRGIGLNGVVLDEFADMRANVWEEIIRPALADKQGWALFIGTPKGFNAFYDLYEKAKTTDNWEAFHFTTYDNPSIPVEEIEQMKKEMSEDKFMQEVMADFRRYEGLVYKEFTEKHIVKEEPKNGKEIIGGVDFGFRHPTAAGKFIVDGDGNYTMVEEYYKTGKTTQEMIEYVKTWNCEMWYPDPAEQDRIEEMRRAGFYCKDVIKNVPEGIGRVKDLLLRGKLKIHERCKNTIREFMSYAYDSEDKTKEKPIKEFDDAMDMIRYVISMHTSLDKKVVDDVSLLPRESEPLYSYIGI